MGYQLTMSGTIWDKTPSHALVRMFEGEASVNPEQPRDPGQLLSASVVPVMGVFLLVLVIGWEGHRTNQMGSGASSRLNLQPEARQLT